VGHGDGEGGCCGVGDVVVVKWEFEARYGVCDGD